MAKSIRDTPKKRGRGRPKTTGRGEGIMLRLHRPQIAALEQWITRQDDKPSRPEAIRRLVEQALARSPNNRPTNKRKALKAAEMAARTVQNMGDKSMPAEEQARRKRALIRGPKEFRDIREDQPRPKG